MKEHSKTTNRSRGGQTPAERRTEMKRTEFEICCGKKGGYDVYRTVMTDGEKYFVKWSGKLIDVTNDKSEFHIKGIR